MKTNWSRVKVVHNGRYGLCNEALAESVNIFQREWLHLPARFPRRETNLERFSERVQAIEQDAFKVELEVGHVRVDSADQVSEATTIYK